MFTYVLIGSEFILPEHADVVVWQTKDVVPPELDTLIVDGDGQLWRKHWWYEGNVRVRYTEKLVYTGEMKFYDYDRETGIYLEYEAFFIDGHIVKTTFGGDSTGVEFTVYRGQW